MLTSKILAEKLLELRSDETRKNAVALSEKMSREDGVRGGLQHFLDCMFILDCGTVTLNQNDFCRFCFSQAASAPKFVILV